MVKTNNRSHPQVTLAVPWGPVAVGARRTIVWHHPWHLGSNDWGVINEWKITLFPLKMVIFPLKNVI
jgi:hypothetical protein